MSATNLWIYNCLDCVTTAKVFWALQEEMRENGVTNFYDELVQPLIVAVMEMSKRGMWVDQEKLEEMKRDYHLRIHGAIDDLRNIVGDSTFNPASPDMLRSVLFEKYGMVSTRETATGKASVDELTIKRLARKYNEPIFEKLLEYRKVSKVHSTYLSNLYVGEGGRIRSRFLVHGTATGRLSSRGPNFQNIPYEVRPIFSAPPGYVLVEADASQLELRLIAYASNCRRLVEAFNNGEDVHTINASAITGKPVDAINKDERDFAKRFVYCQNYGGSPRRVSEILFQDAGIIKTVAECEGYVTRLRIAYPEIYAWRDAQLVEAKRTRKIRNEFGRVRVTFARNDDLAGVAYNTPIQSTAADYINYAFIRLHQRGIQIVNQVHDSIVAEAHEEQVDEVATALKEELEKPINVFGHTVTIPCDVKVGKSWGGGMVKWYLA
jgi:DNA polymerase-1